MVTVAVLNSDLFEKATSKQKHKGDEGISK